MIEPNYDKILKDKIDYYGETKAAYEFAAYEYNKQYIELNKLSIQLVSDSDFVEKFKDNVTLHEYIDEMDYSKGMTESDDDRYEIVAKDLYKDLYSR